MSRAAFLVIFLALFAPAKNAVETRPVLRTLRLDQVGSGRLDGCAISTVVPFAPGELRDVTEISAEVPIDARPLELHKDGSVRYARIVILSKWKTKKGISVELYRGGEKAPLPAADWKEPPPFRVILTDPDGVERTADFLQFKVIESSPLRQVLRADAPHRKANTSFDAPEVFLSSTVFVERFPGQSFFNLSLLLRNDSPRGVVPSIPGAVRFSSYRLEFTDPSVRAGAAWPRENGIVASQPEGKPPVLYLLPKDTKNLWLGDGQTKLWRITVDQSADAERFRSLVSLLEHPLLPGLSPNEWIRARAFGDFGDMVLGPPPTSAAKLALAETDRAGRSVEFGWNGPWGDVKDTHQTGSPRNGLCSDGVLRTLQTGFREWFDDTWRKGSQQALRPICRDVRAAEHADLLLFEGMPHPKRKDQLGREGGFDPRFVKFKEGTSGGYRQETQGWNGFDHEHFSVDDLYALFVLTGDPWIRFELESIGEALLTYDFSKRPETTHSARGDGWVLRGFCNLYKALGDRKYLDAAQNLVLGMDAQRSKGAMKYLHSNSPDPRHLQNHTFEMPWQVAIATNGLAAYYEISQNELAKTIALDLADFLVKDAWSADAGVFKRAVATDGSGVFVNETDKTGTQSWIASGLVAAFRLQPKPEYKILADGIYRDVKAANATFEKGGIQWTWWQSYLRFSYDREKGK